MIEKRLDKSLVALVARSLIEKKLDKSLVALVARSLIEKKLDKSLVALVARSLIEKRLDKSLVALAARTIQVVGQGSLLLFTCLSCSSSVYLKRHGVFIHTSTAAIA